MIKKILFFLFLCSFTLLLCTPVNIPVPLPNPSDPDGLLTGQREIEDSMVPLTPVPISNSSAATAISLPLSHGTIKHGVSEYGYLQVTGTQLCSEDGVPVMLRGISSHGMQWFSQFTSVQSIKNTRDYGANVFRIAMYTAEGGYISDADIKKTVFDAIDSARALDMYVIVDWHIRSDGDPHLYLEQAKAFFGEAARHYADDPAVIYELCNEPNGVSWDRIHAYAAQIIPVIREYSPNALIICGTASWSQDVDSVAELMLPFDNVMYSYHFYSGFHGSESRQRIDTALAAGTPVFVTEWGTSHFSGDDGLYLEESAQWLDYLNKNQISWINWSLCDKEESSAALIPGADPNMPWHEDQLSESGRFVFRQFRQQ